MIAFLLLDVAGCCLLYLSHRHQAWLARPLGRRGALAGVVVLVLALAAGWQVLSPLAAVFAWCVMAMLSWSLLPYAALLKGRR